MKISYKGNGWVKNVCCIIVVIFTVFLFEQSVHGFSEIPNEQLELIIPDEEECDNANLQNKDFQNKEPQKEEIQVQIPQKKEQDNHKEQHKVTQNEEPQSGKTQEHASQNSQSQSGDAQHKVQQKNDSQSDNPKENVSQNKNPQSGEVQHKKTQIDEVVKVELQMELHEVGEGEDVHVQQAENQQLEASSYYVHIALSHKTKTNSKKHLLQNQLYRIDEEIKSLLLEDSTQSDLENKGSELCEEDKYGIMVRNRGIFSIAASLMMIFIAYIVWNDHINRF